MQQVCLSEQQLQLRPSICNVNSYFGTGHYLSPVGHCGVGEGGGDSRIEVVSH